MRLYPARLNERIARSLGERKIGKSVAVNVPELHPAEPKLDSPEPVIVDLDPSPDPPSSEILSPAPVMALRTHPVP